ncbi:MAG TPA: serine/threonine-protein kinase [Candidatus Sulfomarinibacteraceae bacterium]|nr:serine/threonine-protein kinase [Candidatus Sulfomarinibacteraceae bacterium]
MTTRQLSREQGRKRGRRAGQLQPGDMLQERYRIVGTLGVGGFSSVYQARDMRFSNATKLCAVKEMVNMAPDPKIRAMATRAFEREASILATLDHPAVVNVYDYFSEADRSYLVLEFIRGKDLESLINEETAFFSQEQVLEWALQISDVLTYLHNHKPDPVVFRDVKPSNVMLDPHGRIRLIDFGIAKLFQSEEKNTTIGTEGYAPPEQYRGLASPAGDVYGLGATMHHLLTRQDPRLEPPFSFQDRPIQAVNPDVSQVLEKIIMRSVSYDAEDRYRDAGELKKALERVAAIFNGDTAPATDTAGGDSEDSAQSRAASEQNIAPAATTGEGHVTPIWAFKCEDEIRSTPAIEQGTVYVGAYDNNLYALSAADGSFRWKHPASDGIAASPHVYNGSVYIGSADHYLYALHSYSGRLNWRVRTEGPIYSSPRARFEHVFFGSDDNFLYAVNTATGRVAWKTDAFSPIRSSPYVAEEQVFFGTEGGYVFCLDLSGEVKWQFQARRAVTSTPTVAEGMVFMGSMDNTVYALDITSGWPVWRVRTHRPVISSPIVHDGTLFIGSADGNLYAIEISSGRKLWTYETGGQVASSPAVWDDTVYFGSTDGYVYSVGCGRGRLRWRFQTGDMVISSPVIADGIIYIGSVDHHLYALPA